MCTLTWRRRTGGSYEVFFNRDEKKTRGVAEPPKRFEESGVRFLAPRDPDAGGTWMLINERGLLVCLLNRWHEEGTRPPESGGGVSRGHLVWKMAGLENVPAVEERLRSEELAGVKPFEMIAFDPVGERGWHWNGRRLVPSTLEMPICSSSFHFEEVAAARRSRFHELKYARSTGRDLLETFHSDTGDGPSASTVRMCRTDAQTMSRSHVTWAARVGRWRYWEEQPDLAGPPRLLVTELDSQTAIDRPA